MDRFQTMELISRIAETESFTKAAEILRISNSAASRYVTELEEQLGVRLLNRTTRRVSLTEAGTVFYERCQEILDLVAETEATLSNLTMNPTGRLRINAPVSFGILHLGSAFANFQRQYPNIDIDSILNDRFIDLIEEGFDVAIRIGNLTDSSLIARRLFAAPRILCTSPEYLKHSSRIRDIQDLSNHTCLLYGEEANRGGWNLRKNDQKTKIAPSRINTSNNGDIIRQMVLANNGVALLPVFIVAEDIKKGRLVEVLPGWRPEELTINAVYPSNKQITLKVRVFIDFLVEHFARRDVHESLV
jgi:DNA-binding transcriptional LysR family regulator